MVSAPATYWTSAQSSPASWRASPAAATPYSTKLRPHFPQGCMPAPRTATRLPSAIADRPAGHRAPLPDEILVVVVLVEGVEDYLDLGSDAQVGDADAGDDLAHDDHPFGGELDGGDGEGLVGLARGDEGGRD